jgi:molecular chaperone DnaJ
VTVPTLDGEVELEFEPGTQAGEVRVLRGRGMPVLQGFGSGDHRVLVNVLVPRHVTPEQRQALEEFERSATDRTYRADEGFFEKLKSAFR